MDCNSMQDNGKPSVESALESPGRRRFHIVALNALGAALAALLGIPAVAYLFVPPKERKESQWADAGDIAAISANQPLEVAFRRNRIDGWKVVSEKLTAWVVKSADGKVTAFGPQCTHLGCAYHWDERGNRFVCPCHTSFFSIDGTVITGPAPRPLDRYQVRMEGNKLLIGEIAKAPGNRA